MDEQIVDKKIVDKFPTAMFLLFCFYLLFWVASILLLLICVRSWIGDKFHHAVWVILYTLLALVLLMFFSIFMTLRTEDFFRKLRVRKTRKVLFAYNFIRICSLICTLVAACALIYNMSIPANSQREKIYLLSIYYNILTVLVAFLLITFTSFAMYGKLKTSSCPVCKLTNVMKWTGCPSSTHTYKGSRYIRGHYVNDGYSEVRKVGLPTCAPPEYTINHRRWIEGRWEDYEGTYTKYGKNHYECKICGHKKTSKRRVSIF